VVEALENLKIYFYSVPVEAGFAGKDGPVSTVLRGLVWGACVIIFFLVNREAVFAEDGPGNDGFEIQVSSGKEDAQSWSQEFLPWSGRMNVRDFGAAGDGQTDDTDAVMTAIAASSGGMVDFPPGTYRITKTIEISLAGQGPLGLTGTGGTARVVMEGAGPAFLFTGTHRGTSSPLSLDGTTMEKERMPVVENLEIEGRNPLADGLEFRYTFMPVIRGMLIRGVRHGVHLSSRNRNVMISECHIYHCSGTGIYLDSVNLHQINISGCHISYCDGGGILIRRSEIRNCQITGNDIEYNYSQGKQNPVDIHVDCSLGGSVREGTICGNTIQSVHGPGGANIRFSGFPGNNMKAGLWSITGNHISNQTLNIHLDHTHGITISGNTFIRPGDRHMVIGNSDNLVLSANVFDYNSDYFPAGVPVRGGITLTECHHVILGESIFDRVENGSEERGGVLDIYNCSDITVQGCHILDYKFRGIDVENSLNVRVTGCNIRCADDKRKAQVAIEMRGKCTGSVIYGNSLGNNKKKALIIRASGVSARENK